jgi:hypothetical protein
MESGALDAFGETVILAVGHDDDRWLSVTCDRLAAARRDVIRIPEETLYVGTSLVFRRRRNREIAGHLVAGNVRIDLTALSAILLRPLRSWMPGSRLTPYDREFVFHETIAAWYGVMASVDARVVNRFPLPWWLHDASYERRIAREVADLVGLDAHGARIATNGDGIWPTPAPASAAWSVYVIGGSRCIAGSAAVSGAARKIDTRRTEVTAWAAATGLELVRLDLEPGRPCELVRVELFPALETEPPDLQGELLAATEALLAA